MEMLEELKKGIQAALAEFKGQRDEIKMLKDVIAELQKRQLEAPEYEGLVLHTPFRNEEKAADFMTFCRGAFHRDLTAKGMTEGVDADGGYLVPTEFQAMLLRIIEEYGIIRKGATLIPMGTNEMDIPSLVSGVTVYWIGEEAAITESKPVLGNVNFIAKKMAAMVPASSELLEDSSLGIANLLATLFGEGMAEEEDRVGFVGDSGGTDPFDGILLATGTNGVVMGAGETGFGDVTADHLSDMITALKAGALRGAKFYMHRTIFNVIRKLKDTAGDYIYQNPSGLQPGTIWGYPYELTDSLPALTDTAVSTPFVCFGNLKYLYIGDRKKISLAQSTHIGFKNDQTYLRAIQREAMIVGLPAGFAVLTTAAV